ncbi:AUX_IAA domain-containing protein [Cephalotus follicularis]|uniref:Auxin-responsive protein n=1 Tax=Cephalotus follicularis TaxID=3775 RepID=A0A1Q3AZ42_CEPFO|nr:AUX_IAA domain-containing protein [Cephalotus follicularis]
MSTENGTCLPESDTGLNFEETKLTLGLPGESRGVVVKTGIKRGYLETVDLNLGRSVDLDGGDRKACDVNPENRVSGGAKPPATEAQVIGWPPVRGYRKNAMKSCRYVKVAVDGAPYLRKVDLEMYNSYQQLLASLEDMFSCFTIRNYLSERKIVDNVNGVEYVPTYEDKDGDWMLVGDVPWKMFVESCKRLRLMKSSEAIELAPRTPPNCSSTS